MQHSLSGVVLNFGILLAKSVGLLFAGGWGIQIAGRLCVGALTSRRLDADMARRVSLAMCVTLWSALIVAILGTLGIETTGFVLLLGAMALAAGLACSGVLAHLAAGFCLMLLRPFGVGDHVTIGGITGEVLELGLFSTRLNRSDNVCVLIGNHRVLSGLVVNYSLNPYRRVEVKVQIRHGREVPDLIAALSACATGVANVVRTPAPQVALLESNASGMLFGVRPFCHHRDYEQVRSDTLSAMQSMTLEATIVAPPLASSLTPARDSPTPAHLGFAAGDIRIDKSA